MQILLAFVFTLLAFVGILLDHHKRNFDLNSAVFSLSMRRLSSLSKPVNGCKYKEVGSVTSSYVHLLVH